MAVKAEFINLRKVNKALKALPDHVRLDVQQEMNTTAFQVWNHANRSVPVRTGQLQGDLKWQARPRSLSAVVGVEGDVSFYWKYVECGTVKMDPQPFLRPAADALRDDHDARMVRALTKAKHTLERESS
jgi:HK97 gp10 family phage protein